MGLVSIISDERTSIVLYEENQLYALSGVATKKKTGSQANGDSCSMFQLDDGMYHVCVSEWQWARASRRRPRAHVVVVFA